MARIRESQGGAYEKRGRFYMRVTTAPQTRPAKLLPWCTSLSDAISRANEVQALVNRLREAEHTDFVAKFLETSSTADAEAMTKLTGIVDRIIDGKIVKVAAPRSDVVTFEAFAMRWVRGELAVLYPDHVERKRTAYSDLCYLRRYVFPVIGSKPIAEVTLDDYEQIMREVPRRATTLRTQSPGARARRADEEKRAMAAVEKRKLKPGTRRHVAQVTRRVMQLAEYPAKLVSRNPIPANAMPKVRTTVALQFLYPDEDAQLMAARDVPLAYRVLYGFLARMGWRKEEALGGKIERVEGEAEGAEEQLEDLPPLAWSRLDLRRGIVYIDRDKTNDPRPMPLDPGVWRALAAWREVRPNAKTVFVDDAGRAIDPEGLVIVFRDQHLRAAKVDRAELFEKSIVRQPIRVHDLRASFVTVAFANGHDERWVRDRTGHRSGALERYARVARTFEELDLGDWTPLDEAIPELSELSAAASRGDKHGGSGPDPHAANIGNSNNINRGDRRGLNPRQLEPQTSDEISSVAEGAVFSTIRKVEENAGEPSEPMSPRSAAAPVDAVEAALKSALEGATRAGRWDVVAQLARELEARRTALTGGNVRALRPTRRNGA